MSITEEQFRALRVGQTITDGSKRDYEIIGSVDFKKLPSGCIYGITVRPVKGGLPSDIMVFWNPDAPEGERIVNKSGTQSIFNSDQATIK